MVHGLRRRLLCTLCLPLWLAQEPTSIGETCRPQLTRPKVLSDGCCAGGGRSQQHEKTPGCFFRGWARSELVLPPLHGDVLLQMALLRRPVAPRAGSAEGQRLHKFSNVLHLK